MKDDILSIGPAVRGVVLRLVLIAVVVTVVRTLDPALVWQVIAVVCALAAAIYPSSLGAWGALAVVPISLLSAEPDPLRTALAVLCAHIVHVLGALTAAIPSRALVAVRALLPTLQRFVAIQVIAQAAAALLWITPYASGRGFGWMTVLGAVAIVGSATLAVWRFRRPPPDVRGPA